MLDYADGWLFVGLDGLLYFVHFARYGYEPEWNVSEVRREWWGQAYPGFDE